MNITYEYSNIVTTGSIALLGLGSLASLLKPSRMLFLYVALLVFFTGSLYGTEQSLNEFTKASSIFTVYTRGMGKFNISFLNIYLILFMLFSVFTLPFFKNKNKLFTDFPSYCILFLAIFYMTYSMYGLFNNVEFENVVSLRGGIGLLNIFLMYVVVRISLKSASDVYGLEKIFMVCCLLMAIYGLLRLPFGGDPANYYAFYEKKNIRLSFFDIEQAAVFCVAFALLFLRQGGKLMKSLTGTAMALLFLANILLSFRRTAWFGLVLVFLWFLLILDVKRKFFLLAVGVIVFIAGSAIYTSRFIVSEERSGATTQESLTTDITDKNGNIALKQGRFGELYAGVMAANASPLIGLGPWGVNKSFTRDRDNTSASFVHSSIVHVYLKMGLLGLSAYLGLLIGFPLWWSKQRLRTWNDLNLRTIGDAFFCGFVFCLPDICFGTPLIIFRHTQLLALFLAVPTAAWAIDSRMQQQVKVGQFATTALAVLALFIVAHTPGQAAAATTPAPQPEIITIFETASPELQAEITINQISENIISPLLIGTNLHVGYERDINSSSKKNHLLQWQPDNNVSLNTEMINHCRNIGIKTLRFPGGETSNTYHWREGVGPVPSRPVGKDEFGTNMNNFLGTIEYAEAAKAIGAEMIITANYKSGSPQEAANWVEYCNGLAPAGLPDWTVSSYTAEAVAPEGFFAWLRSQHGHQEPLGVRYWEIGNEIYFHKDSAYITQAADYSRLMKKKDSTIKVGLSSDSFLYMNSTQINSQYIPPGSFDFFSVHYYGGINTRQPQTSFYSNGESTRSFIAEKSGIYKIDIKAFGSKSLEWPHMCLAVNGVQIQDFSVFTSTPQAYSTTVQLQQGPNTIAIKFDNDSYLPGIGDCNLYVQGVTYAAQGEQPIEIWNTVDLEHAWLFANNGLIETHIGVIQNAFPHTPIMVTETNTAYGINLGNIDRNETLKLKAGLWVAGLMNSLIRKDVPVFNQWLLNSSYMGFALVLANGNVTPTYLALKMYEHHAGRRRVDLMLQSPTFDSPLLETTAFGKATKGNPYIDAIGSFDENNGELSITFVNRHALKAIQSRISLGVFKLDSTETTLSILNTRTSDGMEASNELTPDNIAITSKPLNVMKDDNIISLTLEPHSVSTIKCKVRQ